MKKITTYIIITLLIVQILLLNGCSNLLIKSDTDENVLPVLAGNTTEQEPISCTVYFSFADNEYLIGQQHFVSVPETRRKEEVIIQELIAGPDISKSSLNPIINPNTRIVSISENNGLLFLTLSSQFLKPLAGTPENWQNDNAWYTSVMNQRKLSLYALVNTLTQTGKYSKVQLFIDYDDSGQGQRPTRGEVGLLDSNSDQLLEPIGRNASSIYSPQTVILKFLEKFSEKNWMQAADYVDVENQDLELNDISSEFSILNLTLIDFSITSTTIAYDGQSAIVTIDYFIRAKDGSEYTNSNVSLLVNLSNDIWKISYISISQLLNVSNG